MERASADLDQICRRQLSALKNSPEGSHIADCSQEGIVLQLIQQRKNKTKTKLQNETPTKNHSRFHFNSQQKL